MNTDGAFTECASTTVITDGTTPSTESSLVISDLEFTIDGTMISQIGDSTDTDSASGLTVVDDEYR